MSASISASKSPLAPLDTFEFNTIQNDLAVGNSGDRFRSDSFSTASNTFEGAKDEQILSPRSESPLESGRAEETRPNGILVAEDNWLLRKALGEGLRNRGFDLWTAANGLEAVELYQQFWPPIDIVLSDVQMPVVGGPEALETLRRINPSLRFCFMTGDTRTNKRANLLRLGALRVFEKPFPSVAVLAQELWELATTPVELIDPPTQGLLRASGPHQSVEGPHFGKLPREATCFEWAYTPLLSSICRFTSLLTKRRSSKRHVVPPPPSDR